MFLTRAELLERLRGDGVALNVHRLKRLRREGLVPCSGQRQRPGLRGSESRYPETEFAQIALVQRLAARERRFDELRVMVAWHGGWVEPARLRTSLAAILEEVSARVRRELEDAPDRTDGLARVLTPGSRSPLGRLMRVRLGSASGLGSIAFTFAALAAGERIAWHEHDPESAETDLADIVNAGTGMADIREWLGEDDASDPPEAALEALAELDGFDVTGLARLVASADDAALAQAFACARGWALVKPVAEMLHATHGPAFALLAATIPGTWHPLSVALLVRQMLVVESAVDPTAFDEALAAIEQAAPAAAALLEARAALPEHAHLLVPHNDGLIAALPADARERLAADLTEFLAGRPDLAAALG